MLGNLEHLSAEILIIEKQQLTSKDVWSTQILWHFCSDTDDARSSQEKVGRELPGQMSKVTAANAKIHLSH